MRYLLVLMLLCGVQGCDSKPSKPETQVIRVETPEQAGIPDSKPDDVQYEDTDETE
jgi:hypothetical protein